MQDRHLVTQVSARSVGLSLPNGELAARWFNPREGKFSDSFAVQGGRAVEFQVPDANDWVLLLRRAETKTLQHFYTEFTSIIAGGLLGLYLLGFLTTRADGRAVGLGIAFAVGFATLISFAGLGWLPDSFTRALESRFDSYYTGLTGNLVMFVVGFTLAALLPARPRDLRNLTLWTQDKQPFD
jgi:hypothetical protein